LREVKAAKYFILGDGKTFRHHKEAGVLLGRKEDSSRVSFRELGSKWKTNNQRSEGKDSAKSVPKSVFGRYNQKVNDRKNERMNVTGSNNWLEEN